MCGFVAVAGEGSTAPGLIERGVAAVRFRGPDGDGVWRSPDGRAALGHARLAILDLSSSGAQPMHSANGRGVIAYNGEIYNYRDLVPLVEAHLRSRSDTEVLVELLGQHGVKALERLRGMFALAYWDGDELLLARDRLGIKPLFWAEEDGCIVAGSTLSAIVSMRARQPLLDGRAVDDYLTYLYVPPPRTGIAGVNELPPGHLVRWKPGGEARVERWWSAPSHTAAENARPSRVRAILEDSVRAHLVSDAPVGVFLSGGLDSSSIVALAARHYPGTLRTFCVTFGNEGKRLDERGFARDVANRFGTDHQEIRVQADVASILPELVERFGQPFGNPTAVLTHALSRATREHVKVALAGDGGDEVLGGYPRYQGVWLADLVQRAPPWASARALHALQRLAPSSSARGLAANRLSRFLENAQRPLETMYFRWVSYLDTERKKHLLANRDALVGASAPDEEFEFLARIRRRHAHVPMRDAACLVDVESFLPHNVLNYGDRMSMAHALEVRVPFCDHVVVESLASLPISVKMPGGIQKGLFRWALRQDLPARVVTHRKVGFNPPLAEWLRGPLAPVVNDYLSERSVRERGLLSWPAVHSFRTAFDGGRLDTAHSLWSLVVLEAWLRWLEAAAGSG
jgi:asparagine synthase (glutamine-hydrolysing)